MEQLFELYLQQPLANRIKSSMLYDKGFVALTGRAIISPHPHRHYTFEEFVNEYNENKRFSTFLTDLQNGHLK